MRLLDLVDGDRSLGVIVAKFLSTREGPRLDAARVFFERLWWHDQVVFDTTAA